jgi:Family of unknown function (DUF6157)
MHTTNYQNTFILIADDCPAIVSEIPPQKGDAKSVANMQYELISQNPYKYTSDEVTFQIYAERNDVMESEFEERKAAFFSKGQPCFRASPLPKWYGWGVHYDENMKMAIYGLDTEIYAKLSNEASIKVLKGMKSSR